MPDRHATLRAAVLEALAPTAHRTAQALGQVVAATADTLRARHPEVQAVVESMAEEEKRAGRRLRDDISKALPADRGPMAATKDARRAVHAALSAQRSQYGPPTGRRDR